MERTQKWDEELLNYLDGRLTDDQARQLKQRLEQTPALQLRLDELRQMHEALSHAQQLLHPSSNFTHRVMSNLHRVPVNSGLSPRNGLLLLCGVLVAAGMLAFLLSAGVFDNINPTIELSNLPVSQEVIKNPLPNISFSGKWIINGIVLLTLGLSFILLDRTVLRPYFNRRSHWQV
ncbi:MAG: anti-sigma factor family protein [Bacteroidota bacterium]